MFMEWAQGSRPTAPEETEQEEEVRHEPAPSPSPGTTYARNADDAENDFTTKGYDVERKDYPELQRSDLPGMLKATWRWR